jgi:hypothetical protein
MAKASSRFSPSGRFCVMVCRVSLLVFTH